MKKKRFYSFLCASLLCFSSQFIFANEQTQEKINPSQISAETTIILDLNGATIDELQQHLDGIGQTKAQNIIEYREKYGPFISVNQLLEVQGIGASLLERNRAKLTI